MNSTKSYFGPPLPYTNLIRLVDEIRLVDKLQKRVSWSDERITDDISHSTIRRPPIIAKRHMNQPNLEYRVALRGHFPVGTECTAPIPALQAQ